MVPTFVRYDRKRGFSLDCGGRWQLTTGEDTQNRRAETHAIFSTSRSRSNFPPFLTPLPGLLADQILRRRCRIYAHHRDLLHDLVSRVAGRSKQLLFLLYEESGTSASSAHVFFRPESVTLLKTSSCRSMLRGCFRGCFS